MKKELKIVDGKLLVIINNENDVFIPVDGKQEKIGRFTQTTIQTIDNNKINLLKDFINNEKVEGDKKLNELKEQFELVKDLQDIDEKITKQCIKSINKGNKAFRVSMTALTQRIVDLDKKKNLNIQIKHFSKQLDEIKNDLEAFNALKY